MTLFPRKRSALAAIAARIARLRADPGTHMARDAAEEAIPEPVAAELAALRRDLRLALWRQARLAAVVARLGRFSHDMRGILSPAMLTAERLQANTDPAISRAGGLLLRSVERAGELLRDTVAFARIGGGTMAPSRFALRALVEEAAARAGGSPPPALALDIADGLEIEADRESLSRAFAALLGNAAQTGARRVTIGARAAPGAVQVAVGDDGPGLPAPVTRALFQPLVPTPASPGGCLGLAMVCDLLRANGGDIALQSTGPEGTVFLITLAARGRPAGA
jgi:signal transduction histidine kinase